MKIQLDEETLNAYINEAIKQELNEGYGRRLVRQIGKGERKRNGPLRWIARKAVGKDIVKAGKGVEELMTGLRKAEGKLVAAENNYTITLRKLGYDADVDNLMSWKKSLKEREATLKAKRTEAKTARKTAKTPEELDGVEDINKTINYLEEEIKDFKRNIAETETKLKNLVTRHPEINEIQKEIRDLQGEISALKVKIAQGWGNVGAQALTTGGVDYGLGSIYKWASQPFNGNTEGSGVGNSVGNGILKPSQPTNK